jgi:hypothetical protein
MKYQIEIEVSDDIKDVAEFIRNKFKFDFKLRILDIKNVKETRTDQQNKSLHLFFSQLAEALNEKHCDMRMIIRDDIEIEWSKETVKSYLWKPLQKALYGKTSTTELFKGGEIDKIYDYIVKIISERTKGEVIVPPFPSDEFYR